MKGGTSCVARQDLDHPDSLGNLKGIKTEEVFSYYYAIRLSLNMPIATKVDVLF